MEVEDSRIARIGWSLPWEAPASDADPVRHPKLPDEAQLYDVGMINFAGDLLMLQSL